MEAAALIQTGQSQSDTSVAASELPMLASAFLPVFRSPKMVFHLLQVFETLQVSLFAAWGSGWACCS
jgi:hypothetical protein